MLNIIRAVSRLTVIMIGALLAQNTFAAADNWQMNMYRGVTPVSHDIYDLHMVAIAICAVIGVIVFGVMIYSLIHHRKSKGYKAATFHDNPRLELVWTMIPVLILIGLAIPATKVLINMNDFEDSDVTIKVTGYQWKWQYQYLNEGISFFSNLSTPYDQIENKAKKGQWYLLEVDNPVVVPVNKKIRFLMTANDVIHSWWVPELGIKRDAMPGFINEAWATIEKPGVYRGQCAELCGINHGFMPIVVKAVTDEEYQQWVSKQPKVTDQYAEGADTSKEPENLTRKELMTLGKKSYDVYCSACHKADGKGIPPMFPALKGSSVAIGKPISRHIRIILDGISGTAMQAFKDQLSDKEIAAITTYERNAWGNNTDDVVQPADVAKVRQGNNVKPKIVKKAQAGGFR